MNIKILSWLEKVVQANPDWNAVRLAYPATKKSVYLNSAANAPLHAKVFQAVDRYQRHLLEEGEWDYWESLQCMERTRGAMAHFIGTSAENIGFGPNSSHNMNLLVLFLKNYLGKTKKNKILLVEDEFPSSSFPWEMQGYELKKIPTQQSFFSVEDFEKYYDDGCGVLVVSHIQYATGFRTHLKTLSSWAKSKGLLFIVNATQSLGSFPVSVEDDQIDALVASCHKRMGAGVGLSVLFCSEAFRSLGTWPLIGWLSVKAENIFSPTKDSIKTTTSAMETGTLPFNTFWALEAALQLTHELGIQPIAQRTWELSNELEQGLANLNLPGVEILSWRKRAAHWTEDHNSGNILFSHPRPLELFEYLNQKKIYISTRGKGVRASINFFNNQEDISAFIKGIQSFSK